MKSFISVFLLLNLLSCSFLSYRPSPKTIENAEIEQELVVVATSDFHSALERAEGMANEIEKLRNQYQDRMIYLDGGDLFQGSLEGDTSKGKSNIQFFNFLQLDAAAIGNHDLDYGTDVPKRVTPKHGEDPRGALMRRSKEAKFQWLSANWIWNQPRPSHNNYLNGLNQSTVFKPHAFFDKKGMKVCVIGATTPTTSSKTYPAFVEDTQFEPLLPVVQAEIQWLKTHQQCDFTLLVAHAGLQCEKNGRCQVAEETSELLFLAEALPFGALDAMIGGHTHKQAQEMVNGIPILQGGSDGQVVGVLHLFKNKQRLPRFEPFISVQENATHPKVSSLLKSDRAKAKIIKQEKVVFAKEEFIRDYTRETALSNLVADAVLDITRKKGAEIAFIPSAYIRTKLHQGQLRYEDIYLALPFTNYIMIANLTGRQLRRSIEIAMNSEKIGAYSGIQFQLLDKPIPRDLNNDGKFEKWEEHGIGTIVDSQNNPIQDDQIYKVATIDYIALGGDHQDLVFSELKKGQIVRFSDSLTRDLIVQFLKRKKVISPNDFFDPDHPRIKSPKPQTTPALQKD